MKINRLLDNKVSDPTTSWIASSLKGDSEKKSTGRFFTVVLFAFIVLFLLITLMVGMRVYSSVNDDRESTDEARLALSLIANNVRMNDTAAAVGVGKGPEGASLVLTEALESGTYETRIYSYQGKIVEEYSIASNAYTPEKAREVVASERFEFEYAQGLLTIYTDYGSIDVALHSAGGAA